MGHPLQSSLPGTAQTSSSWTPPCVTKPIPGDLLRHITREALRGGGSLARVGVGAPGTRYQVQRGGSGHHAGVPTHGNTSPSGLPAVPHPLSTWAAWEAVLQGRAQTHCHRLPLNRPQHAGAHAGGGPQARVCWPTQVGSPWDHSSLSLRPSRQLSHAPGQLMLGGVGPPWQPPPEHPNPSVWAFIRLAVVPAHSRRIPAACGLHALSVATPDP